MLLLVVGVVGVIGACNGLFGLEPAIDDQDQDGVPDVVDNCPQDPNPQQLDLDADGLGNVCDCQQADVDVDLDGIDDACDDCIGQAEGVDSGGDGIDDGCEICHAATGLDGDGDGIDDGCDPCLFGPDHDEDGDGIADGCDNCPSISNPDQAASTPPIGDACFVGGVPVLFDPFVAQDPDVFPGEGTGWTWEGDALVAASPLDKLITRSLRLPLGAQVMAETRLTSTDFAAILVTIDEGRAGCTYDLSLSQLGLSLPNFSPVPPVPVPPGPIRIRLHIGAGNVRCVAIDDAGAVVAEVAEPLPTANPRLLRLQSSGATRFDYVWVITR